MAIMLEGERSVAAAGAVSADGKIFGRHCTYALIGGGSPELP